MSSKEFNPDPSFTAWGPFIRQPFLIQPVLYSDIIIASIVFGLAMIFGILAACVAFQQTKAARRPLKSAYIWMVWLELAASIVIGLECLLYLLKVIRPSFYFFMSILLNWSIQVQLLLQIIINRIRVILTDKRKGKQILVVVAIIVTLIDISVFCIWMPARLQKSARWIDINNIWDRVEKVLYLVIDAVLNWYFIYVVKANLVKNGLEKYNKLVRFNQRIIVVSLLMDVMIIAAMNIPNGFVYAIFHPLAYLVKLNIEMSMANLIKKIALGKRNATSSRSQASGSQSTNNSAATELPNTQRRKSHFCSNPHDIPKGGNTQANGIWETKEYSVRSDPRTSDNGTLQLVLDPVCDLRPGSSSCYSGEMTMADVELTPRTGNTSDLHKSGTPKGEGSMKDEVILV